MSGLRVLISGASIAGPMTAYWLARAGATVTIVERFPSLRPGGQNVDIRSVGVTVMRKITGMTEAVQAVRPPIDAFTWVDDNGEVYAEMKPSGDPNAQTLVSEYEIYRGDLSNIICSYLEPFEKEGRVKFIFSEQTASLSHSHGGPVTVTFANGTPSQDFDLIIAADGSHSRTRTFAFPGTRPRDHIDPQNIWAAYFTIPSTLLPPDSPGGAHNSPPGRFYGLGRTPSGEGTKAVMLTALPGGDPEATLPFREAQAKGEEALRSYVAHIYADAGWRAPEIVRGMWESKDFYASEIVQVHPPALTSYPNRIALVGDAGYASGFGTGTSLAMCGAYVLAGEILSHPGDLKAGLEAYEERMRPIVREMQKLPPGLRGFLAPQTGWGLWARNVVLRVVCAVMAMQLGRWFGWLKGLMGWLGSAFQGDGFELPEYDWVA